MTGRLSVFHPWVYPLSPNPSRSPTHTFPKINIAPEEYRFRDYFPLRRPTIGCYYVSFWEGSRLRIPSIQGGIQSQAYCKELRLDPDTHNGTHRRQSHHLLIYFYPGVMEYLAVFVPLMRVVVGK